MIRFENVSKEYSTGNIAVKSLNLNIKEGEFFVLIGPSGCGKTTTLKMINRLVDLSKGTIYIRGKKISDYNIHELRWDIGYVLQQIALFPHMTIEENIAIVPELKAWDKKKIYNRVTQLLDSVGLDPEKYRNRKPSELSGGEQQRVGVIRALAANPSIILMDEPFSALDPISRQKLQDDILKLQRKIKKTIVFVTHDMQEALNLGDRICVMKDGEIVQCDTPNEIINNHKNDFVRDFFESGNVYKPSLLDNKLTVENLLDEGFYYDYSILDSTFYIDYNESIENLLSLLVDKERIAVKKNGKFIATITNENIVRFISLKLQKGA